MKDIKSSIKAFAKAVKRIGITARDSKVYNGVSLSRELKAGDLFAYNLPGKETIIFMVKETNISNGTLSAVNLSTMKTVPFLKSEFENAPDIKFLDFS